MPLATEPVNFTWSLPALTCRHGVSAKDADFRGEFFQKVKETKTTLDRIYLSSLTRNREKAIIYDYEKWARKGGKQLEKKLENISQSFASKHRPDLVRGPIRPLGVDDRKIEAALQCGLWDDGKSQLKKKSVKIPHIMTRVQCYDLDDDDQSDMERLNPEGAAFTLDSSKVFRVMQEETREQANRRLKKGKCGGRKIKKQGRQVSPSMNDHVVESEDDYTSSYKVNSEEEHSKRSGGIVTKVTHRQNLDFSTIKERGVTQSDTVEYRLPKLYSKPINIETEEQEPIEDELKLPLLEGVKKIHPVVKKKRSNHCKKLSRCRRKKKSEKEKGNESSQRLDIDDDIETELALVTPVLEDVSSKLSDISRGRSNVNKNKTVKNRLMCKKENEEAPLTDFPFMSMGIDESSSDEECLCDECLAEMSPPSTDKKPMKSILSPRRRKRRGSSAGSGKGVSFADTENLEDIRLISPLAVRNENMKRFEEEDRRERLNQRDIKRRERRKRERERFAALNQASRKKAEARQKLKDISESKSVCPETMPPLTSGSTQIADGISHGAIEGNKDADNSTSKETEEQNVEKDGINGLPSLDDENDVDSGHEDAARSPRTPNSEVHEVEALMLDPQDGRLYEDIVLEKGNGKITVAQLGYRIKSIFDRDLPPPASPKPSSSAVTEAEIIDHETDKTPMDDEDDDNDKPFVTKCVDWNETTESASTSRSTTPVEKEDMSEFIMSMKNCRYIRWSKGYQDMLEKMEK
ncbi:uncharacterized protein LOC764367 [Strongylocentrotus purpuratus]|uniref:Uncharacterized protein n=1 Tax=Strongylocentrotus purpuratus TaxID=7668 RepID=A0A7M7G1P0_STRPU|nr:uncharacterized protein LOC764367 [Strongylocentrotus purpuratus]